MTALSFVWVHPYSQNSGCDTILIQKEIDRQCASKVPFEKHTGEISFKDDE